MYTLIMYSRHGKSRWDIMPAARGAFFLESLVRETDTSTPRIECFDSFQEAHNRRKALHSRYVAVSDQARLMRAFEALVS